MTLVQTLISLTDFILVPFYGLMDYYDIDLTQHIFKLGFGSIEWINLTYDQLLKIGLSLIVWYLLLCYTFKLFKWCWSFVFNFFRGDKK